MVIELALCKETLTSGKFVKNKRISSGDIELVLGSIYFHQYNSPASFLSISLHFVYRQSFALNQSAASMTLYKPRHSESTTTFIKATQIKRDESDSQSLTKVL